MSGSTHAATQMPTATVRPRTRRILGWMLIALIPTSALAVTTTAFDLDGTESFEDGKFEGTALLSDGRLVRAPTPKAVELKGATLAYTSVVDAHGRIFVGTGNEGEIHRVEGEQQAIHAKLEAAVVTALVSTDDSLFAGAMPSADIARVDAQGKVSVFCTLPGVEQVWALAYDAKRKRLYAGTGPDGKVFSVDSAGKAEVLMDLEAEHVLSLAVGEDGAVYAGTSDEALLFRHDDGRSEVVYDFPGEEVSAISLRDGYIAVAANSFPDLPVAPKSSVKVTKAPKLKPGKGTLWLVHPSGRAEPLYALDDSHLSDVEIDQDGSVFAAAASSGKVLRVNRDGEHGVWAQAEGRQVLALGLTHQTPHFVASDGAAVFRMVSGEAAGTWTSEALDAVTRARWGELTPRFSGDVMWQTRSGNAEEPDVGWSPWARPTRGVGPVRSPAARYLQVRVSLRGDAELRSIEALFLADNRPARSRHVRVEEAKEPKDADLVDGVLRSSPTRKLQWDTDNPDDDTLSYRLHFARDGSDHFIPILRSDEQLAEAEYAWDTTNVPDGLYRVRVTTSDAPSNPAVYASTSQTLSELIRVDNHAPTLEVAHKGDALRGRAQDTTSRIAALTISVDGGPFLPVASDDDLLDQRTESFVYALPKLGTGTHLFAVRATDVAGNARIEQVEVRVP